MSTGTLQLITLASPCSFNFLNLGSILVGTIIVAPLNEACTKFFSIVAIKSQSTAPFNKMLLSENVFEIRAGPNKHYWLNACCLQCPINKYRCAGHFN
jgi:hypothetical protein